MTIINQYVRAGGVQCIDEIVEIASGYAIVKMQDGFKPGIDLWSGSLAGCIGHNAGQDSSYSQDKFLIYGAMHAVGLFGKDMSCREILRAITAYNDIETTVNIRDGLITTILDRYGETVSIEDAGVATDTDEAMRSAILFMMRNDWLRE